MREPAACTDAAREALGAHGLAAVSVKAPFPVWLVDVPDILDQRLDRSLSPAEQGRAARFLGEPFRRRYRTAHSALRLLGECYFGVPAAQQCFQPNAFGKPALADLPAAQCSISYSGAKVLVAWSADAAIGVDIEVVRRIDDAGELIVQHCTEGERSTFSQAGETIRDRDFLGLWVRKEACMKSVGKGLAIAPSSFDCGVGPGIRTVKIDGEWIECENYDLKGDLKGDLAVAWARQCHAA